MSGMSIRNVIFPAVLAVLFANNITGSKAPVFQSGRDVYFDRCAACHGEDGRATVQQLVRSKPHLAI